MSAHISVLLNEVIDLLGPKDNGVYFDGTFGGGGYTREILNKANCNVIACDRDSYVKTIADNVKLEYGDRFTFYHSKFSNVESLLQQCGVKKIDGAVLDLGVSNFQLSEASRGFSFRECGPLDMSMGLCEETALDVIRRLSEKDLANVIYEYGEEHFSRRIASAIKKNIDKINTTTDLTDVIHSCMKKRGKIDTATKTFQALRIYVNREIEELKLVLTSLSRVLNPGGKIAVVSFHSLEDREVKIFFKQLCLGNKEKFQILTKKPIVPSDEEVAINPKSRSAKLRGICMVS